MYYNSALTFVFSTQFDSCTALHFCHVTNYSELYILVLILCQDYLLYYIGIVDLNYEPPMYKYDPTLTIYADQVDSELRTVNVFRRTHVGYLNAYNT